MMDAAAEKKREEAEAIGNDQAGNLWHVASFWLLWAGIFSAIGAVVYIVITMNNPALVNMVLAGGVLLLMALFVGAVAMKKFFDEIGRQINEDKVKYDVVTDYASLMAVVKEVA